MPILWAINSGSLRWEWSEQNEYIKKSINIAGLSANDVRTDRAKSGDSPMGISG